MLNTDKIFILYQNKNHSTGMKYIINLTDSRLNWYIDHLIINIKTI